MIARLKSYLMRGRQVSLLRTLQFRVQSKTRNVFVYPGVYCYISKSARVKIYGQLNLGCQWKYGRYYPSQLILQDHAKLKVSGSFSVHTKCDVWVNKNAVLTLGSGFINSGANIFCFQDIQIGQDVAIAENVTIRDSDNHVILGNSQKMAPIKIGDHVWIGMNVTILKGVTIGNNAIVAAGSVVVDDVPSNAMVAGVPARVKKMDIQWGGSNH